MAKVQRSGRTACCVLALLCPSLGFTAMHCGERMKKNDWSEESLKTPPPGVLQEGSLTVWAVSDGKIGHQVQAVGLVESLHQRPIVVPVKMRWFWCFFPGFLKPFFPCIFARETRQKLDKIVAGTSDCPDLVVSCGKRGSVFGALCKRLARKHSRDLMNVHILNPIVSPALYDWVIIPEHDPSRPINGITFKGSLNRITEERLKAESRRFPLDRGELPSPRTAVLLGGGTRGYRGYHFRQSNLKDLVETLESWHKQTGGSFMITTSRRTPKAIRKKLKDVLASPSRKVSIPHKLWDGRGENPYFAWLEQADAFIVTSDSINMISEAASSGKPVHICPLGGGGGSRSNRFHQSMEAAGITRPLSRRFSRWTYVPLAETKAVGHRILQEFVKKKTS